MSMLISISEFNSLMAPSGGPRGNSSPEEAFFGGEIHLHSGIATAVVDVAGKDFLDSHPD